MANYACTVASPLSPKQVFDYVADLRNIERWDPGVSSSTIRSGLEPGVGTSYAVTAGGTDLVYRTLSFDRPKRTVLEARTATLRSYDVITVAPDESGSTVIYNATLELTGPLRVFDPLLGLLFKRIGDKAAGGLEDALLGSILVRN